MHEQTNGNALYCRRDNSRPAHRRLSATLLFLTISFCAAALRAEVDPYTLESEVSPQPDPFQRSKRIAAERQELYRKRLAIPEAVVPILPEPESQAAIQARADRQVAEAHAYRQNVLAAILLFLVGALALRRYLPDLVHHLNLAFNPWALDPATAAAYSERVRAEDAAFDGFLSAFHNGPSATPANSLFQVARQNPLEEFHANTSNLFATSRKLLHEIKQGVTPTTCRILSDLCREMRNVKGMTAIPELLPAWQTATALEGLLKQLTDRAGQVNPSTLRTVAAAVELLENLCQPGVRTDLLSNPPLRLLVVDDDLISRRAVSLALKKALNEADLAENGEKALALATMHAYDAIFLDVQMPGMDGFELCTHIHKTIPNAETPVVFVTCMSDFDARAQSVICGGSDLIGKPFLTFEITVKALTLVLETRLRAADQTSGDLESANDISGPQPDRLLARPGSTPLFGTSVTENPALSEASPVDVHQNEGPTPTQPDLTMTTKPDEPASDDLMTQAFLTRIGTHIGALRDQVQAIFQISDEAARQAMLADFYLRLHSLMPGTDTAKGHPALRMIAAVEGLLKKLLQDPIHCTSSTLFSLATAVDVLSELCAPGVRADLASIPPIRMLVADDDPIARRAIACALQTAFEKPEDVACGEAALAAAQEKPFDVIFLDIQMPRMDGFTASTKIRERGRNRTTPVVFVTSQTDFKSRTQATLSGGNDFIGKPFLTSEITVKALTFALRGRLRKLRTGAHWLSAAGEQSTQETTLADSSSDRASERREARRRSRRVKRARQSWYHSS